MLTGKRKVEWGKQYYRKNKERKMEQQRKRRQETVRWLQDFKKKLVCFHCDESFHLCLDFHHKDSSLKDENISRMTRSRSKTTILREISKCDVVCKNCHTKLHHGEGIWNR